MTAINNGKYRYFIGYPSGHIGQRVSVTPTNTNKFSIQSEKQDGQVFFRRKLNGTPVLIDNDYAFVKSIESNTLFPTSSTSNFFFIIQKECNGVFSDFWTGQFNTFSCKFDDDNCKVEIKNINILDRYTCLLNQRETKYNLFTIPDVYTCTSYNITYTVETRIETQNNYPVYGVFMSTNGTYYPYYLGGDINPIAPPYTLFDNANNIQGSNYWYAIQQIYDIDYTPVSQQSPAVVNLTTVYSRLSYTTLDIGGVPQPPSTGNWSIGNPTTSQGLPAHKYYNLDYANFIPSQLPIRTNTIIFGNNGLPETENIRYTWATSSGFSSTFVYDRNRTLIDAIKYAISPCNLTFVSDFFTNNTNPITHNPSKTNNLLIAGKTDIIDPISTEPQTLGEYTFNDIETWMREIFQVYWDIDDNGNFICEHIDYWKSSMNVDIDATAIKGGKYIVGTNKYEYIEPDAYSRERWTFVDMGGIDFKGADIIYSNAYVNVQDDNVNEHTLNNICTDLGYIEASPSTVSKEGFVLLACEVDNNGNLIVGNEVGLLSQLLVENGHLSTANLQFNYWRYWRVWNEGMMNNVMTPFLTTKRIKLQTEIQFPLCCQDYDESKLITTTMGNGEYSEADYNLQSEMLKVQLLY